MLTSFKSVAQTYIIYKYSYTFSISGNQSLESQKNNIDFLRSHFSTKKCTYDTNTSKYTLFLEYLIDTNKLKTKLIAIGVPVSNEISLKHLDSTSIKTVDNEN